MIASFLRTPFLSATRPAISPSANRMIPTRNRPAASSETTAPATDNPMEPVDQSRVQVRGTGDTFGTIGGCGGGMAHGHDRYSLAMGSTFQDFNRALIKDLREHGGKATSGPFEGRDILILTTTGAKSGEVHENPLVYTRDGDHYVIVASKSGAPTNPSWYHNVVAHPDVTVEVHGKKLNAHAHIPDGDEYERLYQQHASINPNFHEYREKTSRKIPVVVLETAK